jgi:hypothetical protein
MSTRPTTPRTTFRPAGNGGAQGEIGKPHPTRQVGRCHCHGDRILIHLQYLTNVLWSEIGNAINPPLSMSLRCGVEGLGGRSPVRTWSSFYMLILLCRPTSHMPQNSGRLCCTQSTWRVVTIVQKVLLARTMERKKAVYVLFMTARVAGRGKSELIIR